MGSAESSEELIRMPPLGGGGGGGRAVTVIADVPLRPSLVAVIVAEPPATPVTSPLEETVATTTLDVDHVTTRPVSTFPLASRSVACSCVVCPVPIVADDGLTATVATGAGGGAVTVIPDVPLRPSLVAVIVAEPTDTPLTNPLEDTVATPALEVDHVMVRPVNTFPLASRNVACNCVVWPACTLADPGATVTVATGAGGAAVTVMAEVPLLPSLVAVIVADPAVTPVTRPEEETVATEALDVVHVIARPVSTLPLASRSVA
jgi:hypothetical protein